MEPTQPPRHGVLAGNYKQYNEWCRRYMIPLREALFVSNVANLSSRDVRDMEWHITGTYYARPDANEILMALRSRGVYDQHISTDPVTEQSG